jgi:hypothetical protein
VSRIAHLPMRFSTLARFGSSPAHALHAATVGFESTMAMRMGTSAHAATLEPHKLVVYRAGTFTDKKGKTRDHSDRRDGEAWEQFRARKDHPADAVFVNEREHGIATAIAAALRQADAARRDLDGRPLPLLFGPGVVREANIRWTRHGRACSSTPDARLPGKWIADLKIARSGKPSQFIRAATWAGYHAQLEFYSEADAAVMGLPEPTARLFSVVVEPFAPYVVTTYELDAFAIDAGRRLVDGWWSTLVDCEATDYWPGYAPTLARFTCEELITSDGLLGDFVADATTDSTDNQPIDWSTP